MPLVVKILLAFLSTGILGFFVSYIIVNVAFFEKFFGRKPQGKIERESLKSSYYDDFRKDIVEQRNKMEKLPFTRVTVKSFDGLNLSARYYDQGSDTAVIFFHGARSIPWNSFGKIGEDFLNLGYDVLLVDMCAQGESEGRYMSYGILEAQDVLSWIKMLDNGRIARLILYGSSMGASAIGYASDKITDKRVKALVLDCGFSSANELQRYILKSCHVPLWIVGGGFLLGKHVAKAEVKTTVSDHLINNDIPTLFIHGDKDTVVPISQGEKNYSACKAEKQFFKVEGAGHTVALAKGGKGLENRVLDFIDRAIKT